MRLSIRTGLIGILEAAVFNLLIDIAGAQAAGGPVVNSVSSGTLVNGQTYTISGSGFGTKAGPGPAMMDWGDSPGYAGLTDMSDTPAHISTPPCPSCPWREAANYYRHKPPKFVTNAAKVRVPGRPVFWVGNGSDGFFRSETPWVSGLGPGSKVYLSWWNKWSTPVGSDQAYFVKLVRFYNSTAWNSSPSSQEGGINAESAGFFYYGNGGNGPSWTASSLNTWHHYELTIVGGADLTVPGTRVIYKVDGDTKVDNSTNFTAAYGFPDKFVVWGYDATDPYDFNRFPATYDLFFSEFYADNTLARIEIGNNASYTACNHLELQLPQDSWSAGSIQFKANIGSFPSGQQLYLYVTDADGNVSGAGIPITFASPGTPAPADSLAPAPPGNLRTN